MLKAGVIGAGHLGKIHLKLLKEIANLGHEVTYHYDVLDANSGDYSLAKHEFLSFVDIFPVRQGFSRLIFPTNRPLIAARYCINCQSLPSK